MAIARFKDLCIDTNDPAVIGPFWADALGGRWEPEADGGGWIAGPTPRHTVWVNRVPEEKTAKHRVHLDIYVADLTTLKRLGSSTVRPQGGDIRWHVLADPEGNEFCAFVEAPAARAN